MEVYITALITTLLVMLKASVKNTESKAKLKKICLKAYQTIAALYSDDPDFETAAAKFVKARAKANGR